MKRRPKKPLSRPALGRNLAVRPGAGPHKLAHEKREADRLRREIGEQREPPAADEE
jgi:hypothetical protein